MKYLLVLSTLSGWSLLARAAGSYEMTPVLAGYHDDGDEPEKLPWSFHAAPNGNIGIGTERPRAALDVALSGTGSSAIIVPRDTTDNRPLAPVNGMLRYAVDRGEFEGYVGGRWAPVKFGRGGDQSAEIQRLKEANAALEERVEALERSIGK